MLGYVEHVQMESSHRNNRFLYAEEQPDEQPGTRTICPA
jgi:hypothetical protein